MLEILFPLIAILLVLAYTSNRNDKLNEKARKKRDEEVTLLRNLLATYNSTINSALKKYVQLWKGYAAYFPYKFYNEEYREVREFLRNPKLKEIGILKSDEEKIIQFCKYYDKSDRIQHNQLFIENELESRFRYFSNIEGKSLDLQQRTAIVKDEDNGLIIAGAGTGKTSTIVGKVKYLTEKQGVDPNKILLISFTRKTVNDLLKRINTEGVKIETFHSYGRKVILETYGIPSIFDQEFSHEIKKIANELKKDAEYLKKTNEFFLNYFKREWNDFELKSLGENAEKMREENFQPLGQKYRSGNLTSLNWIKLKSQEERKIADFLFCQNVEYEYEKPHPCDLERNTYKIYRPDFTIFQGEEEFYLEHFGINEDGIPAPIYNDREGYAEGVRWKRAFHRRHGTELIESYSYENLHGVLLKNLAKKLNEKGVILSPKSPEEIDEAIRQFDKDGQKKLFELIETFIVLVKSNNFTFEEVWSRANAITDNQDKIRTQKFLEIVEPIYASYQEYLIKNKVIDFSDMINKASEAIKTKQYNFPFEYLIIDEFQDLSIGRYQLIKAMKIANPFLKIFAVGDDWQSIYRFTGSDIALFKNFEHYFGFTEKSKIETTYRFGKPLIQKSSEFIMKNENQWKKELVSYNTELLTEFTLIEYHDFEKATEDIPNIFISLSKVLDDHWDEEILILGRYNFDVDKMNRNKILLNGHVLTEEESSVIDKFKIVRETDESYIVYENFLGNEMKVPFMSVHKAKGLEADNVIILNNDSGKSGFPSLRADDPILNTLLSEADQFENGEERRLFYVALTRAKKHVYLFTPIGNKSKFITEFFEQNETHDKCPQCKKGDIRIISGNTNGRAWYMKSCSNFVYGCKFQMWL